MAIGLIGAHRVGKTTLAAAAAEKSNIPFIPTNLSAILRREKIDLSKPIDIMRKMEIQQMLLDETVELFKTQQGSYITDRTPLDMLAYVLAEIGPHASLEASESILKYSKDCFTHTNQLFDLIVLVQPGIEIKQDIKKETAPINQAYIETLNYIMTGLIYNESCTPKKFIIQRDCIDFDKRAEIIAHFLSILDNSKNYYPEGTVFH